MNLKAKAHEENRTKVNQDRLSNRVAALEAKSIDKVVIQKDPIVKKIKADICKAKRRLTQIAVQETLLEQKKENKAQKAALKIEAKKAPGKAAKAKKEDTKPQKKEKKTKTKK